MTDLMWDTNVVHIAFYSVLKLISDQKFLLLYSNGEEGISSVNITSLIGKRKDVISKTNGIGVNKYFNRILDNWRAFIFM